MKGRPLFVLGLKDSGQYDRLASAERKTSRGEKKKKRPFYEKRMPRGQEGIALALGRGVA